MGGVVRAASAGVAVVWKIEALNRIREYAQQRGHDGGAHTRPLPASPLRHWHTDRIRASELSGRRRRWRLDIDAGGGAWIIDRRVSEDEAAGGVHNEGSGGC